jgi:arsenite methyltransferase
VSAAVDHDPGAGVSDDRFSGGEPSFGGVDLSALWDELPLWSAPFGLALLETVALRPGIVALDIGCGTGFPVVELAQRLGSTASVHGVDPWSAALECVRRKLQACGVSNVTLHESQAEHLPLADASVDLIVSNNGLNNVDDIDAAVAECARVARPGAQLVYTCNLPASMREFYDVYDALLGERGFEAVRRALVAHIFAKRKPLAFTSALFERSGFRVERVLEDSFPLRFADATAMFAHSLVRLAFLPAWLEILDPAQRQPLFAEIERRLNARARVAGDLTLTVPFACFDCRRLGPA